MRLVSKVIRSSQLMEGRKTVGMPTELLHPICNPVDLTDNFNYK